MSVLDRTRYIALIICSDGVATALMLQEGLTAKWFSISLGILFFMMATVGVHHLRNNWRSK